MKKHSSSSAFRGNFKLLVDPQLKKGQEKLIRFNGGQYSCDNHGQAAVVVRDPRARVSRLWSRKEVIDLPVPRYKVDENYTGDVPPREVTFSKLNDNVTKQFMEQLCSKFGKLERVRVYHHPKTNKHMGLAKVVFHSIKSASICISSLHQTSIMGNIIRAEIDSKGELLKHLFNKIIRGEILAETMPDVIRHTQEKSRPTEDRRKSLQEDPRRRSSSDRKSSVDQPSSHGPRTPPNASTNEVKQKVELQGDPTSHDEITEMSGTQAVRRKRKKMTRRHERTSGSDVDTESNATWSTELEHRIESMLHGNQKSNLDGSSRSSSREMKSTSSSSEVKLGHTEDDSSGDESDIFVSHNTPNHVGSIDLEDGECSGDEPPHPHPPSPHPTHQGEEYESEPDAPTYSPPMVTSGNENSHHGQSPVHIPSRSPPRPVEMKPEPMNYDRHRPNSPIDFPRRSRSPFHHDRYRPRSRSPEYLERRHFERFHPRHRSPSFEHRHRHSPPPFDHHRPRGRSPFNPGAPYGGYRGRPNSPGYNRPMDFPPGHPEFRGRRSPSPRFGRRRRSISPLHPRFGIRREFDVSPRRERYRRTPPGLGRHRREPSPRFADFDRHRRRSPGFHREPHFHPPSSPDSRRLRDKRELPPEFQERWSRQRSQSPHHPPHFRSISPPRHDWRSPTRKKPRSPKHVDDRPYSPGDLQVGVDPTSAPPPNTDNGPVKRGQLKRKLTASSDQESLPQISLDARLREMTGEEPESPPLSPYVSTEAEIQISNQQEEAVVIGSDDMEISSGGSTHSPNISEKVCFNPPQNHPWQYPQHEMWNGYNPRMQMWCQQPGAQPARFPPPNGFPHPQFMPDCPIDVKMLPPPPPGWNNRPWVQPPMSHIPSPFMGNPHMHDITPNKAIANCALNKVSAELKEIMKKDLNRKVIESMAFKVYEAWWDAQYAARNPKPITVKPTPMTASIKLETPAPIEVNNEVKNESKPKLPALLNTFDPLNWAKGSMEMDGFRIGLGLRSAISKMPSFRVKKRTPSPTIDKSKLLNKPKGQVKDERGPRKRIRLTLDSEGEDQGESDYSDADDKKPDLHGRLDVDEVFSSSSSSSEEDSSEDETDDASEEDEQLKSFSKPVEDVDLEPPSKRKRENLDNDVQRSEDVMKAASLLSELQSKSVPTNSMKHIHPKKRFRLLSTDATSHETSRLRSDDELAGMSDKEKAALEVLTDMKLTPERRLSSMQRLSSSDSCDQATHPSTPGHQLIFSPPLTPASSKRPSIENLSDPRLPSTPGSKSDSKELEAVQALLSIKQSHPPIPPLSPPLANKQPLKKRAELRMTSPTRKAVFTQEDRDRMTALAEEHNYFATSPRGAHKPSYFDPTLLQILEEHNYSCPSSLAPKTPPTKSRDESSVFVPESFSSMSQSPASAAELVKLRRTASKEHGRMGYMEVEPSRVAMDRFKPRTQREELGILYKIWEAGLDVEDMKHLRHVYEEMLATPGEMGWVNDTHWVPHPTTHIPTDDDVTGLSPTKRGRRKRRQSKKDVAADPHAHKTGCARSEGYYKVNDSTKLIQRRLMYRQADNTPQPRSKSKYSNESSSTSVVANEKSRETRHMMRRIASEFGSDASDLLKYNQLMYRKKCVKFKRSHIHGWGLFAEETIGADEMVIEYVGQLVRSIVADRREVDYTKRGIGSSYLFRIDTDHIIDATKCGNFARFMNHSCNPSCYAKVISVDGAKKIVIYSKDTIKPSDEITYDYKFPIEDEKIPCFCGASNCRGTLN